MPATGAATAITLSASPLIFTKRQQHRHPKCKQMVSILRRCDITRTLLDILLMQLLSLHSSNSIRCSNSNSSNNNSFYYPSQEDGSISLVVVADVDGKKNRKKRRKGRLGADNNNNSQQQHYQQRQKEKKRGDDESDCSSPMRMMTV